LEKVTKAKPKDGRNFGRIGMIHAAILRAPKEAIPFATKGWELGDTKSLEVLGIALMMTQDRKLIELHADAFLDNFENLRGAKGIGFYVVAQRKDIELFRKLLGKVTLQEINSNDSLAKIIAKTSKLVLEK
jgi:hypothetical protein